MNIRQKSEPKRNCDYNNIYLPFIYPMRTDNGDNKWPFNEKGFTLINGIADKTEKCVRISDESAVIALNSMGYFGDKYDSEINNYLHSTKEYGDTLLSHQKKVNQNQKLKTNYLNGKYVLVETTVPNAVQSVCDKTDTISNKCDYNLESKEKVINEETNQTNDYESLTMKLSFCEAFFLSYSFGCLNVFDSDLNKYMNIEQMWNFFSKHFADNQTKFASFYSSYHYFRSKGWIVRNGLSFGCDFLLYKESPHFYHSLYSVTIIEQTCDANCEPNLNWHQLSALIRLTKNVRKEALLCYVCLPKQIESLLNSPNCIEHITIKLLHLDRWLSSHTIESG